MLHLPYPVYLDIVGHAYDELPDEACGLLGGGPGSPGGPGGTGGTTGVGGVDGGPDHDHRPSGDRDVAVVERFYRCRNTAESSRVYTVDPRDHLRADRDAEDRGGQLIGVVHSHTHTDAYPSPTDVRQAVDPAWHYVIVSLRLPEPVLRSYRIVDGKIAEESVVLVHG
ncbi:MAG: M67 family metallopeptidase [Acidimicrobiales bacterium]|jgi:proteasome lid subunit RPN8/RPN11|nr:M67 family metallopeptidase [Acidimicrobiales bacterium]